MKTTAIVLAILGAGYLAGSIASGGNNDLSKACFLLGIFHGSIGIALSILSDRRDSRKS